MGFGSLLLIGGYIAAQMLADIASVKIAMVFSLAVDAGTFVYPLTFTLRDLIHKQFGKQTARQVIIIAALINIAMVVFFAFVVWLPADSSWAYQQSFKDILGPVWRIVFASILAEVISELTDTEIYHYWTSRITRRYQWSRVLVSNAVSVPLDSILFCFGAFWSIMPMAVIWEIIIVNILVKSAVTLVSLPAIYAVHDHEQVS
ncbi:MAG TPA: queuosine precursor transporter [bacterium]|nr:queuosine precursor transporter [bacterium]